LRAATGSAFPTTIMEEIRPGIAMEMEMDLMKMRRSQPRLLTAGPADDEEREWHRARA
jgi:hypothetical protein